MIAQAFGLWNAARAVVGIRGGGVSGEHLFRATLLEKLIMRACVEHRTYLLKPGRLCACV